MRSILFADDGISGPLGTGTRDWEETVLLLGFFLLRLRWFRFD